MTDSTSRTETTGGLTGPPNVVDAPGGFTTIAFRNVPALLPVMNEIRLRDDKNRVMLPPTKDAYSKIFLYPGGLVSATDGMFAAYHDAGTDPFSLPFVHSDAPLAITLSPTEEIPSPARGARLTFKTGEFVAAGGSTTGTLSFWTPVGARENKVYHIPVLVSKTVPGKAPDIPAVALGSDKVGEEHRHSVACDFARLTTLSRIINNAYPFWLPPRKQCDNPNGIITWSGLHWYVCVPDPHMFVFFAVQLNTEINAGRVRRGENGVYVSMAPSFNSYGLAPTDDDD